MRQNPSTIGVFRILSELGRGGAGVVYRAEHLQTGEAIALKTVTVHKEALLGSIRREIRLLARLHHPSIVRICGEGIADGVPWYAMELVEGVDLLTDWISLAQRVAPHSPWALANPAPKEDLGFEGLIGGDVLWSADEEIAPVMEEAPPERPTLTPALLEGLVSRIIPLCDALAYLHGEGLVHCDLKPQNVLIRTDGRPVLMDFGIAARFGGDVSREVLDTEWGVAGTVGYMPPEQIRHELLDARADLYALGCLLYQLLTGELPFQAADLKEMLEEQLSGMPPAPSTWVDGIPPALDALILRLLARHQADRFGYAWDVAVALHALLPAAAPLPPCRHRSYLYRPELAGREQVLEAMHWHLLSITAMSGLLVLMGGEAGIGKTRLALELRQLASASGVQAITGECPSPASARGTAVELGPLQPLFTVCSDLCREQDLPDLRGALDMVELWTGGIPVSAPSEPGASLAVLDAAQHLFESVADVLEGLCRLRAVVFLIDDLQWADELTLGTLRYLVRSGRLSRIPLLVLATFRSDEDCAAVSALSELSGVQRQTLERLDRASIVRMAGGMLAMSSPPELLIDFLERTTEGNPFFLAEYLRSIMVQGLLVRDARGGWVLTPKFTEAALEPDRSLALPGAVQSVVGSRLQQLPVWGRILIESAAVIGRELDLELLRFMLGLTGESEQDALDELVRRSIFEEVKPGQFRFVHDRIRELIWQEIPEQERRRLHRRAAEGLELRRSSRDERVATLARHWELAGKPARAVTCYLEAARASLRHHALGEAERQLRRCISLAPAGTPERFEALRLLVDDVLTPKGKDAQALELLNDGLTDAVASANEGERLELLRRTANLRFKAGQGEDARQLLASVLEGVRARGDRKGEGAALHVLALTWDQDGNYQEAARAYQEALQVCRETGMRQREGLILHNLGRVLEHTAPWSEALATQEQVVAIARELGDLAMEGGALSTLAMLHEDLGRLEDARAIRLRAEAVLSASGHTRLLVFILHNEVCFAADHGYQEDIPRLEVQLEKLLKAADSPFLRAILLSALAYSFLAKGALQKAEESSEESVRLLRRLGYGRLEPVELGTLAKITGLRGNGTLARERFQEALDLQRKRSAPDVQAGTLLAWAKLERRMQTDPMMVFMLLDEAEALVASNKLWLVPCLAACERGHLALTQGLDAAAFVTSATAAMTQAGARPTGEAGQAVARLRRAIQDQARGRPLLGGESMEDIPSAMLPDWMQEDDF